MLGSLLSLSACLTCLIAEDSSLMLRESQAFMSHNFTCKSAEHDMRMALLQATNAVRERTKIQ